jgi:hypothetical protein
MLLVIDADAENLVGIWNWRGIRNFVESQIGRFIRVRAERVHAIQRVLQAWLARSGTKRDDSVPFHDSETRLSGVRVADQFHLEVPSNGFIFVSFPMPPGNRISYESHRSGANLGSRMSDD